MEFHVDMSGVCATIEDGEGESLVSLVKFVSRTEETMRNTVDDDALFRFEAHLRVVVIMDENLGGLNPETTRESRKFAHVPVKSPLSSIA